MLELFKFIFSSFWVYLGTLALLATCTWALAVTGQTFIGVPLNILLRRRGAQK